MNSTGFSTLLPYHRHWPMPFPIHWSAPPLDLCFYRVGKIKKIIRLSIVFKDGRKKFVAQCDGEQWSQHIFTPSVWTIPKINDGWGHLFALTFQVQLVLRLVVWFFPELLNIWRLPGPKLLMERQLLKLFWRFLCRKSLCSLEVVLERMTYFHLLFVERRRTWKKMVIWVIYVFQVIGFRIREFAQAPWLLLCSSRKTNIYLISSLIPLPAKKDFMLDQEVSRIPIRHRTASKISLMIFGGTRSDRISVKASGLMFPTACWAASTKGVIDSSSLSISSFLKIEKHFWCYLSSCGCGTSTPYSVVHNNYEPVGHRYLTHNTSIFR